MDNEHMLNQLEKLLGISFINKKLLLRAITQRSYPNEHREARTVGHNETYEYLGDAVLSLAVREYLVRNYPDATEGNFTRLQGALVNNHTLTRLCQELKVESFLRTAHGTQREIARGGVTSVFADMLEAIIGAFYLDRGHMAVQAFVLDIIIPKLETIQKEGVDDWQTDLQEAVQAKEGLTPEYRVLERTGPDHNALWKVGVFVGERLLGTGIRANKKEARKEAARQALTAYRRR